MADEQTSQALAKERTDWAEDRTLLANERTFAAWMRTGMAALAVGVGLQAVFWEMEPTWVAKLAATGFALIAITIFQFARRAASNVVERLNAHQAEPISTGPMQAISWALTAAAAAVAVILWSI